MPTRTILRSTRFAIIFAAVLMAASCSLLRSTAPGGKTASPSSAAPAASSSAAEAAMPKEIGAEIPETENFLLPPQLPRLVVVVVLDQFRADYVTRFAQQFGPDGFKRLMREGYWARDCRFRYAATETAPGHATIHTGCYPHRHGIVDNSWYSTLEKKNCANVEDEHEMIVGSNGMARGRPGASAHNLAAPTFGVMLKAATNGRAKVVSLSYKDRAAILPAGPGADLVLWWDTKSSQFVTSTAYAKRLPPWVVLWNDTLKHQPPPAPWALLKPENAYALSQPDDAKGESESMGGRSFPHPIAASSSDASSTRSASAYSSKFLSSPQANEILLDLAAKAIGAERLGRDEVPDYLSISFTCTDYAGHNFGPYSREMQDFALRSDLLIARLLSILDEKVGKGEYAIFVTADHGVAPIPETLQGYGLKVDRLDGAKVRSAAEEFLQKRFPAPGAADASAPAPQSFIAAFQEPWVYLNAETIRARGAYLSEVRDTLRDWLAESSGLEAIAAAYTTTQLSEGRFAPDDDWARALSLAVFPGRTGDVAVVVRPNWLMTYSKNGTNHGTPHYYDQSVPLLASGKGIVKGREVFERVEPIDIVPTIAQLLAIEPPACAEGRVLPGALLPWNAPKPEAQ